MIDRLHATIEAVCPIVSVRRTGLASGEYEASSAATAGQLTAADAALAAFDWSQAAHDAWLEDQKPQRKAIRQAATNAVAENEAFIADANVTNAEAVVQVKRLSNQMNHVIRRLIQLD